MIAPLTIAPLTIAPLPATSPISGFFWTWVLPVALFSVALAATWLLYRHFSRQKRDD